jgi:hypothetical protein
MIFPGNRFMFMKTHTSKFFHTILAFILITGMLGFAPVHSAKASTLTVVNTSDSGAGSLRQAIANASSGDTITFDSSLSGQTITLASTLVIDKNLTIDGSALSSKINISGNSTVRVFEVATGVVVTMDSLRVVNGFRSSVVAGGILNRGTLDFKNGVLSGNIARHGGAIDNAGTGILYITNSTISGNSASSPLNQSANGGGIVNEGTLTITNSIFSDNHTGQFGIGGGIVNHGPRECLKMN